MAAKRVLAALAAALLIVGAVIIRRAIDDPSGATTSDGTAADPSAAGTTIACIDDLAVVCASLAGDLGRDGDMVIEPFTTTLTAIAAGEAPDAWVTFAPLDRLAVDAEGALAFGDEPVALASTRLALATRAEREPLLAAACGATVSWQCIGERAGEPWSSFGGQATWGNLAPGHDNPSRRALGLLTIGAAAAAYFESTTFNAIDIDADPGFLGWFSSLERAVPSFVLGADAAIDTLATGRAVDVVGTSEAEVARLGAAPTSRFVVTYPEPVGRADAVLLSGPDARLPEGLADDLRQALLATPGFTATPPEPNPIPSAGVLRTLLDLWESIR
jgi:hypothetical protein